MAAVHCFYLILIRKQSPNFNFNCYYYEDRLPTHTHAHTCIWHFTLQMSLLSSMVTIQRRHSHFGIYFIRSVKQSHDEMFVWKKEEEEEKWKENKNKTKTISFPNPADVFKLSVLPFKMWWILIRCAHCWIVTWDRLAIHRPKITTTRATITTIDWVNKSKLDGGRQRETAFFWVNFDKYTAERWNPN